MKAVLMGIGIVLGIQGFAAQGGPSLNLYVIRDSSDGEFYHFKMRQNVSGRLVFKNTEATFPEVNFYVDSSDMLKIRIRSRERLVAGLG